MGAAWELGARSAVACSAAYQPVDVGLARVLRRVVGELAVLDKLDEIVEADHATEAIQRRVEGKARVP